MLDGIFAVFKFLFGLFNSLSKESQEVVKEQTVNAFDEVFRRYHERANKQASGA